MTPDTPGWTTPPRAKTVFRILAPVLGVFALAAFVILLAVDASLGRIEVAERPTYVISAVHGPSEAREAWCLWHTYEYGAAVITRGADMRATRVERCLEAVSGDRSALPQGDDTASTVIRAYVWLDALFVVLYVPLVLFGLRAIGRRLPDTGFVQGLKIAMAWPLGALLAGLVVAELAEATAYWTLASPRASAGSVALAGWLLAAATPAKWAAVGLIAAIGLASGAHLLTHETNTGTLGRGIARSLGLVRSQLVVTLIFVALISGIGNDQITDVLLRWADIKSAHPRTWPARMSAIAAILGVFMLGLAIWRSVYRAALAEDEPHAPGRPVVLVLLTVAVVAVATGLGWANLSGLAAVLAAIVCLSWIAGAAPWHIREPDVAGASDSEALAGERGAALDTPTRNGVERLGRILAGVPILAFGVALLRAAVPAMIVSPLARHPRMIAAGIVFTLLGAAFHWLLKPSLPTVGPYAKRHTVYKVLMAVTVAVYAAVIIGRHHVAVPLGSIALAAFFLIGVVGILTEAQRLSEITAPVAGLRLIGFRRTPVLGLLVAWFVIGSMLDAEGVHSVRMLPTGPGPQATLTDAFSAWTDANCGYVADSAAGAVPMVFVAASGGGIRAAYFTAAVLDDLFPMTSGDPDGQAGVCLPGSADPVFAASGISGGSLGIVQWLAADGHAPPLAAPQYVPSVAEGGRWYDTSLGADHLSAATAWLLYVDTPRAWLGYPWSDRAAMLEHSWELALPALNSGYLDSYGLGGAQDESMSAPWRPLALLNGTAVESGCRTVVAPIEVSNFDDSGASAFACRAMPPSNVELPPGASALTDVVQHYVCHGQDVRYSTAALLSARFPGISPSGAMQHCSSDARTYIVDGGYVEGTGSLTAVDLFEQVSPLILCHNLYVSAPTKRHAGCVKPGSEHIPRRTIQPWFIQIDNGYLSEARRPAAGRPRELLVPPAAFFGAARTSASAARQRAVSAFGPSYVVRLANHPQPGVQAPLGWVLSSAAMTDLKRQARAAATQARKVLPLVVPPS